jgi:hypothetical protein
MLNRFARRALFPARLEAWRPECPAVLTLSAIEDGCDRQEITLVVHPAIRRAIKCYEDSFYIGVRCFLEGEGDGVFFLPLQTGGYVRLLFSKRCSVGGFEILRLDPIRGEDIARIKREK